MKCQYVGCNSSGHEAKHHHMAVTDYMNPSGGAKGKGSGGGAGGKGSWTNPKGGATRPAPFVPRKETTYTWPTPAWKEPAQPGALAGGETRVPCKYGYKCREVLSTGKCENHHSKEDFKFMTDKYKAKKLAQKGMEKGKKKGDGKKAEGQQRKGDKGKGKGPATNDRKCYLCQGPHLQRIVLGHSSLIR